jgi:hypothetical protein
LEENKQLKSTEDYNSGPKTDRTYNDKKPSFLAKDITHDKSVTREPKAQPKDGPNAPHGKSPSAVAKVDQKRNKSTPMIKLEEVFSKHNQETDTESHQISTKRQTGTDRSHSKIEKITNLVSIQREQRK